MSWQLARSLIFTLYIQRLFYAEALLINNSVMIKL